MRYLQKASGKEELYNREKLLRSLVLSGLDERSAADIAEEVEKIRTTREIYEAVRQILLRKNPEVAARYSLKDAIMRLGPTGFPFEEYMAELLRRNGHDVLTHQFIRGRCTTHEIDLLIDNEIIGECKYHNERGIYTGLKEAMYTYMRFIDIRQVRELKGVILVTNTKFSDQAIEFSGCYGLNLLGWKYPPGEGLEVKIERSRMYPITVLSGLIPEDEIAELVKFGVVSTRDLIEKEVKVGDKALEVAKVLYETELNEHS
ncbi:MAG: ATPase [Thermoproteota archaeon]|nr:MAG: ATPase [Candidatus Korarchaeota archaeon]